MSIFTLRRKLMKVVMTALLSVAMIVTFIPLTDMSAYAEPADDQEFTIVGYQEDSHDDDCIQSVKINGETLTEEGEVKAAPGSKLDLDIKLKSGYDFAYDFDEWGLVTLISAEDLSREGSSMNPAIIRMPEAEYADTNTFILVIGTREADPNAVKTIDLTITPPKCGTKITGDYLYDVDASSTVFTRQTPQPKASVPFRAAYELNGDERSNYGLWLKKTEDGYDEKGFEGTIKGGKSYDAWIRLQIKNSEDPRPTAAPESFSTTPQVNITGGTLVESEIDDYFYGRRYTGYMVIASVKAKHVPGKATKKTISKPTCTKAGYHYVITKCTKCGDQISKKKVKDKALGHNWGAWKVVKKPTLTKKGLKKRVCKRDASHVQKKAIPKIEKPKGVFLAKLKSKGSTSLVLSWNKLSSVDGYDVFFHECDKSEQCKKVKTIKGNSTLSWTKEGLEANYPYKAYVKAWIKVNGKKTYVKITQAVHEITAGGSKSYTNPAGVTVNKTSVSLGAGRTTTLKAEVNKKDSSKKLLPKKHGPELRYISSNKKVAAVSDSGKITAKAKGKCKVYVLALNGVKTVVKVTVK